MSEDSDICLGLLITHYHSLLEKSAVSNTLRAVKKHSTVFVTDLLLHKEGAPVSKVIR